MKTVVLGLVMVAVLATATEDKPHYDLNEAPQLFEKYVKDYNKHYKDAADREIHYKEFVKSLEMINKLNTAESTATFDINQFSDYTLEESKFMNGVITRRD